MIDNERYQAKKQEHIVMWERIFGPKDDGINWRGPNCWTIAFLIVSFLVSRTAEREVYFGFINHQNMVGLGGWFFAFFAGRVIDSYAGALQSFSPKTPTAAKQANEQIKLFATFLNSIAVGIVGVVALKELVDSRQPDYTMVVCVLAGAIYIHAHARAVLKHIKNESIT